MHANGKGVKSGISPGCTDNVFVTDGISTETLRPHLLASNSEVPNSNMGSKSHNPNPQHVEVIGLEPAKGYVDQALKNGVWAGVRKNRS